MDDILVMAETISIEGLYHGTAGESGVCDQSPQISTHSISSDGVLGAHSQLIQDGA